MLFIPFLLPPMRERGSTPPPQVRHDGTSHMSWNGEVRIPHFSNPFLHGALAVQYVAWCALSLELKDGVEQHQQAQCQDAGNDNGNGFHCAGFVVQLDDDVHVLSGNVFRVDWCQITAHEVLEDGARIARLHPQPLIVELPVLFIFVEICESCKTFRDIMSRQGEVYL